VFLVCVSTRNADDDLEKKSNVDEVKSRIEKGVGGGKEKEREKVC
jgi:hypothetical protein